MASQESQIKTSTDYSNSFLSPKSHYNKPVNFIPFGLSVGKNGLRGTFY